MKKALLIASVLFIAVVSTACINNIAVQELNNKAAEYMQKGDYESAMNRLQASIDLDASMYETHYNLGIAALNAKKYDKAIEALENGIKIKPDYVDFYYSLGSAQTSYADELVEQSVSTDKSASKQTEGEKTQNIDNTLKAIELKQAAASNFTKYLELNPTAEDKENVQELIKDCNTFIAEKSVKE